MKLNDFQAQVDAFREKEVPRQVDEIASVIATLDELAASLEAAKEEAMVSYCC